ncbi:MAG: 3-hydroxyacyl-ACP dehydratase FabZ [Oscillospiraceae bacterium]|jgi:3-hydroxyacyl-[acyl-carrier-protein] dehydratase|nr:3-hydroxyacyl-ACP dehydratase FabZ [Oscillospiraceae bacterium]
MKLTSDEIRGILPHRYPFLLIDRVEDCEPGQWAKAIKCVSANEPHFTGHFPQRSIMPGVLIIEALAQTGGIALLTDGSGNGKLAVLAGIKNARFVKPVVPGDVLELECRILRRLGGIGIAEGNAKVNGEIVCKVEITFALTDSE